MENQTYITRFQLLSFSSKSDSTKLIASVFSFLYMFGVLINTSVITVVHSNVQLHTPMYLFLCNLALVDICYTTTTVPNLLHMLLSDDNTVSFIQCFTQMFFYMLVGTTEDVLIFIMALDRYIAICDPLHYHHILNMKNSILLASGTWIAGCLNSFLFTIPVSNMSFCNTHIIRQFFCDAKALFNISCEGSEYFYIVICVDGLIFALFPVTFCLMSYIKIISVILQIKSRDGRKTAFSTCSSHLTVLIIYYLTSICAYTMPPLEYLVVLDQAFTVLYSVITPIINPLIYSLRNKDMKYAQMRLLGIKF